MARKINHVVAARLSATEFEKFEKFRGERTTYSAVRELVLRGLEPQAEPPTAPPETPPTITGNFSADVEAMSKQPVDKIGKWLKESGWAKETTGAAVKKSGAYHDENLLMELHAMIEHGRPDLFEIKYFVDLAYYRAVLARALMLAGVTGTLSKEARKAWQEINHRPAMPLFSKSESQRRTHRYKAARATHRGERHN